MNYSTITSEGGLLPSDILEQIAAGELRGQRAEDFGLPRQRRLTDEIAAAWGDARIYWMSLKHGLRRLRSDDPATTVTREQWMLPLLRTLGYTTLTYMPSAARVENRTYALSHRAGLDEDAPPIHIEGIGTSLEKRPLSGRPRLSPHALMQEYLNTTEHVWGLVANGFKIRLLRDWAQVSRPRYVEFDLQAMLEGEKFSEFALMYRVLHRSRLPVDAQSSHESWLELYHQQALERGGRVREGLREGVEHALVVLGNGFLQHPANVELRQRIASEDLTPLDLYRQLLRLVYRLLFLMVAEERHLIAVSADEQDQTHPLYYRAAHDQRLQLYLDHYSVSRLRRIVEHPGAGRAPFDDMWLGLQTTFRLFEGSDERGAELLGLAPLNGDLFGAYALRDLHTTLLRNHDLLQALGALSLYRDPESNVRRRVNYSALDVEELGSVYESLLDYRPLITTVNGRLLFELVPGTERKTTGSYYTRPELVHELIKSALDPVIEQRLQGLTSPQQQEQALLRLTVCDPACGSGHFLLAAARRIGRELAKVRSGEEQPSPHAFRIAVRDVIAHCIYGVDLNPLAVDLCKLALWIEGHAAGFPLSFLDHHIKYGNSLIGTTQALIEAGLPDDLFIPVTGDDSKIAASLKKRNKQERRAWEQSQAVQGSLFDLFETPDYAQLVKGQREVEALPDTTVQAVRTKHQRYQQVQEQAAERFRLFDLWTAAFFIAFTSQLVDHIPTTKTLLDAQQQQFVAPQMLARAQATAQELHFFHWELQFPLVFEAGGFDVILGNPPWERIKLQEQEFFAAFDQAIVAAPNKAARQKLINRLPQTNPALAQAFEHAKHSAEATSRFVRAAGRFPLTAVGDINTYALFSELDRSLLNQQGRAGIIVPTGIATDDTTKAFFGDLNAQADLVSLYDFENREAIFPGVHRSYRFVLMTLGQTSKPTNFLFFATNVHHLEDEQRQFTLTGADIALLNPNTRTCPVFRTKTDAELTKKIYRHAPVLENEATSENPWGISFMTMFHMSNDSNLFVDHPGAGLVPLYEGKMVQAYDHRAASVVVNILNTKRRGQPDETSIDEYQNPYYFVQPQYWIDTYYINQQLAGKLNKRSLIGFRRTTHSTNERTCIFTLLPVVGVGDSIFLIDTIYNSIESCCLLTILNSLTFDYVAKQKVGGVNLNFFIVKQLPVLPPDAFSAADRAFISERVLELVYTAWDMQGFAEDVWAELDEQQRARVVARNVQCNRDADPALFSPRDEFALPPFCWNETRRAEIRAELDARIARLYGLTRDELRYILDPADIYGPEFPGETFRVLKNNELKAYGEYRTQRLVLAAWDRNEA